MGQKSVPLQPVARKKVKKSVPLPPVARKKVKIKKIEKYKKNRFSNMKFATATGGSGTSSYIIY